MSNGDVFYRLRNDDAEHRRRIGETQRPARLRLTDVDGKDTAAHDLGDVCTAVQSEHDAAFHHPRQGGTEHREDNEMKDKPK